MFDSYIVSNTKTSLSMPLACPPPPRKLKHSKGFKRFAFTLAETLITLTIIGVIAALTVPNLLNKYTKHTYVVGLKKAYSQLQNAVKMIPITEGCSAGDYDCAGMFQDWNKVTNIDGMNFNGNVAVKQLYLISKNLKTSDIILEYDDERCFDAAGDWTKLLPCIILQDGMIFASYSEGNLVVDVNGQKGPNKHGRDRFMFYLSYETFNSYGIETGVFHHAGAVIPFGSQADANYNKRPQDYWKNSLACNLENVNKDAWSAVSCTGRVLEEDAMNY